MLSLSRYSHSADALTQQIHSPSRYNDSADTITQQIQSLSRHSHSADTITQQMQSLSRYSHSAHAITQQIQSLGRYNHSADSITQQMKSPSRYNHSVDAFLQRKDLKLPECNLKIQISTCNQCYTQEQSVWMFGDVGSNDFSVGKASLCLGCLESLNTSWRIIAGESGVLCNDISIIKASRKLKYSCCFSCRKGSWHTYKASVNGGDSVFKSTYIDRINNVLYDKYDK